MANLNIEWGEILKEARLRRHLTQEDVAGMIGVKRQTISALETGKNRPSPEMIALLSNIYNVDLYRYVMLNLPADYVAEQREYKVLLDSPMDEDEDDFVTKTVVRDHILKNDIKKLMKRSNRTRKKKKNIRYDKSKE